MANGVYSFKNINGAISGPGGAFTIGQDAGLSDGGIRVEYIDNKNTMVMGAGGDGMHSLHASNAASINIEVLKTSPVNALLMGMFNFQKQSSAYWGQNQMTFNDTIRGDTIIISQAAFQKATPVSYGKEGGMNNWHFDAISCNEILGDL